MNVLKELISLGCRFFVAGVFLYASYDKIWDPAAFSQSVAMYDLLPLWAINSASVVLAWLEMFVALFLFLGLFTRAAALWGSLLLLMFTGLMLYAGLTGVGYDCGCFPGHAGDHAAGYGAALRDLAFFLASVWVLVRPGTWLRLDRLFWRNAAGGLSFETGFPPRLR